MQRTKEAELTSAVLIFVLRCVAEADYTTLKQMEIGDREIEELRRIDVLDLFHAESLRAHCLSISFNRDMFWTMIKFMRTQRSNEDAIQQLIDNDAPYEMVHVLHGMSTREYTTRRKSGTNLTEVGRTQEPSEDEADELWEAWSAVEERDFAGRPVDPVEYLSLADQTELSLRSVWLLTERWLEMDHKRNKSKLKARRSKETV